MPDKKTENQKKEPAKKQSPDEEPNFNTVLGSEDENGARSAKGISRASAVLLALMAALAGGAIGWAGPVLFGDGAKKTAELQAALTQTKAELSQAGKDRQALSDRLDQVQTDARAKGSASESISQNLAALQAELDDLKARPAPVDNSEAISNLNEQIATLSAFGTEEGTQENLLDLVKRLETLETQAPSGGDMTARLEALETDLKSLSEKTQVAVFPEPDKTPIEIPKMETKEDQENALQVLVTSFPRAKMLEAVKAQEIQANKKPSWLQRTLSKHVKVRDDELPDPAQTIDDAEKALKAGEITEAIRLINTLNPPVKVVAADWISAAKKTAKLIEKDL